MDRRTLFMFSGQGSQYYQMGRELYENHEPFRYWMNHSNKIVSSLLQTSLIDILYQGENKSQPFDRLLYSNPALLCVEYSLVTVLREMDIEPDFLMGYSLGEITASVVSDAISLEQGIELVIALSLLAEQKSPPAAMLAIMESSTLMDKLPELFRGCRLTATNFQGSFVVGGLSDTIRQLQQNLSKKDVTSQRLPVNYGFHTELIDPFETDYKQLVRKMNPLTPKVPMISSSTTGVVQRLDEDYFWGVIRHPIKFEQTVRRLLKTGDYIFIDVGPSGSLATFVKYMLPPDSSSLSLPTINPFGNDLSSVQKIRTSLLSSVN